MKPLLALVALTMLVGCDTPRLSQERRVRRCAFIAEHCKATYESWDELNMTTVVEYVCVGGQAFQRPKGECK